MNPPSHPKPVKTQTNPEHTIDASNREVGWYLYGITLREAASRVDANSTRVSGASLSIVEHGRLAAITRPVPLAEFSSEALQARAQDLDWLEAMVRDHNQVVARIHQADAILPVKFGSVYPGKDALQAALAEMHDALLAQLRRIENCDEWGLHLYADHQAIQRLIGEHPAVRRLQDELAAASPGRAYLLKRKLADAMTDITEQALSTLAQVSYRRLAGYAVAGQISPRSQQPANGGSEREALHATFLVQRAAADAFLQELEHLVQEQEGLRCEYSGPWPPYSFASIGGEEKQ
jgi:hypothetical protein